MFLINQNAEEADVVACILLLFRKMRHQSNMESIFPHLGGKWRRSEPGSAPIDGGKKGEFRDRTKVGLILEPRYKLYEDAND